MSNAEPKPLLISQPEGSILNELKCLFRYIFQLYPNLPAFQKRDGLNVHKFIS